MCGTGLIVAWRPWRREGSLGGGTWGGAVGFGVGFMIAFAAVAGRPELVPVDVTGWLFHAAAVAMVLGLLEATAPRPAWLGWILRFGASAGAVCLICRPMVQHTWSSTQSIVLLAVLVPGLFATWASLDGLARRAPGATVPLVVWVVATAGSIALVLSRTAKLSQLAAAIAAMAGAALVVAWWNRSVSLARGAAGVTALVGGCLWLAGCLYAELPVLSAVLLAAAPSAAWAASSLAARALPAWQVTLVRAVSAAVPAIAALVVAIVAGMGDGSYGD